jgi:hypothetical protein
MDWDRLLEPAVLGMAIPILALVYWILHAIMKHRERMAMIEQGMNPDSFKDSKRFEKRLIGRDYFCSRRWIASTTTFPTISRLCALSLSMVSLSVCHGG